MKKLLPLLLLFLFPLVSAQLDFAGAIQPILKYGVWGIIIAGVFLIFLIISVVVGIISWKKKKWYLTVLLKMPREGGKTINSEVGRGYWDARKATLWVKRKGITGQKFFVQMDDIRKYLHGNETIELLGSGVIWKPILFDSYLTVVDDETGQEASVMSYKMDFTKDKNWAIQTERALVNTFSLSDAFSKLKDYIGWGLVIGIVILAEIVRIAYIGK